MTDVLKDPAHYIGISALETDKFVLKVEAWTTANDFQHIQMAINEKS